MKKFIITHSGDKRLGIPPERAEVVFNVDAIAGTSRDFNQSHTNHARIILKDAFEKLWDLPVKVTME